ncbi:hypothetical protein [Marinicella sp. W31]|uniref:hypothetical protein n=1 Tax=Marinicella sp. W31 TaxID=3023713 RepID=UPI003756A231
MRPALVALLCALIPFVTVHATFIYSVVTGHFAACVPYLEGCVSISRAARSGDSIHLFRALMLPMATVLVLYWLTVFQWLRQLYYKISRGMRVMRVLGVIGALFLILYATFLGTEGDVYRWLRRYGVIVYFAFTALAQLLFTQRLYQLGKRQVINKLFFLAHCKIVLCIVMLVLGVISAVIDLTVQDRSFKSALDNIIEWNFALLMTGYFFFSFLMFKKTGFELQYRLKQP